ncbi:MAG: hypothetical protein SLRJCFUN_000089 [Candidatus Fervidibacter sp.]
MPYTGLVVGRSFMRHRLWSARHKAPRKLGSAEACPSPMSQTPHFLIWNVGIGTNNPQAKLEVNGILRLTPSNAPSTPLEGMMYYDNTLKTFRCATFNTSTNQVTWQTCGGGTAGETPFPSPFPFRVYNQGRLVLEINEE